MQQNNFTYSFTTAKTAHEVFQLLSDPRQWWSGVYNETITGSDKSIKDEFTFLAGEGMHFSKQKLVELITDKKIVWEVTESNLRFLKDTNEWTGSKLTFDITTEDAVTKITFTHEGLVPAIECYSECSNGWMQYLTKLKNKLNEPVNA